VLPFLVSIALIRCHGQLPWWHRGHAAGYRAAGA
jgi:hypothetical protein